MSQNIEHIEQSMLRSIHKLAECSEGERKMLPHGAGKFPSVDNLAEAIRLIKTAIFPDFLDRRRNSPEIRTFRIGVSVEKLFVILKNEIANAIRFDKDCCEGNASDCGREMALQFIDQLPHIKHMLFTDIQAMFDNDPAVDDYAEIILSYPIVQTMVNYRVAHALLEIGVPVIPRILTEQAHSATGIDIHPGAKIGEYFAIDHGTGVVIGETAVIGNHVTIYQGVTLGARNFTLDSDGHPINVPRHPILEDYVTVYSNASILGRITVGHGSIIGGNIWLTHSVPPNSRILQNKALNLSFSDGAGI